MNTLPEKLLVFGGKPFIEPFSNFLTVIEVLLCERVPHGCESNMRQSAPDLGSTAGAEKLPIQANSTRLLLISLCGTVRCRVAK